MKQILIPFLGFFIGLYFIAFIGGRIGRLRSQEKTRTSLYDILIGSTAALALYSLLMSVIGVTGYLVQFNIIIAIPLLIASLVVIYHSIRRKKSEKQAVDPASWAPPDAITKILFWLLVIFQVGMFINALAPFINLDCETYHYLFIREWFENGRIGCFSDNGYSYYPLAIETTLLPSYIYANTSSPSSENMGPEAANLGLWFMQLLLMGWLISFCAKRGKIRVGYLLATAVSGLFYWPVIAYSGDIDGGVTLFSLAGVFTYFDWLENRSKPDFIPPEPEKPFDKFLWTLRRIGFSQLALTGLFLGTALASKYSALPIAGLVFLHALWILITDRQHRKTNIHAFVGFLIFMIIPMLPWYGRNLILTGNPIFPFMREIFGGPEPAFADDIGTWTGWGLAVNFKNFILYPIKLAMFYKLQPPWQFIRIPYMYMSWLFALVPLAGILLLHRRIERIAAIWCLVFFVVAFFVMNVQTRYFLPFTILGLWLVCEWLESLAASRPALELKDGKSSGKRMWAKWLVFLIVLIPFLTQFDLVRNHMIMKWPYLSGQMTRTQYEEHVWPSARIFNVANDVVQPDREVVIFSLRSYRLDVPNTLPPEDIFASGESNSEILDRLSYRRANYLLIDLRVMMSARMITWILDNGIEVNGGLVFDEDAYLEEMGIYGIDRNIARDIVRHQGGERFDDAGVWKWRIDLSKYERPYEGGIFRFLAGIDEMIDTELIPMDSTDEWALFRIH